VTNNYFPMTASRKFQMFL